MPPLILNNVAIESRESDKYVNATQLCTAGGKKFGHWLSRDNTALLINALSTDTGIPIDDLVDSRRGNSTKFQQGSWVHPDLAIPIAQWISPIFQLKVSRWITEWRQYDTANEARYQYELANLAPSHNTLRERCIRDKLCVQLHAQSEVSTLAGFIDVLSDEEVIEVKRITGWKHAVGQVLSYGYFYPEKRKHVYLFGDKDELREHDSLKYTIECVCAEHGIRVSYYEVDDIDVA